PRPRSRGSGRAGPRRRRRLVVPIAPRASFDPHWPRLRLRSGCGGRAAVLASVSRPPAIGVALAQREALRTLILPEPIERADERADHGGNLMAAQREAAAAAGQLRPVLRFPYAERDDCGPILRLLDFDSELTGAIP